ncbi:MAG: hypothetical protein ACREMY_04335 [bacterium]
MGRTGFFREIVIYVDRTSFYHSSYECPDYPQPADSWVAWPFFQKPI